MMAKHHLSSTVAGPPSKTRRTGIDSRWKTDFPCMQATDGDGGVLCTLCRKHSRRPKKAAVGRAVWVDLPCHSITRQALVKHSQSESHDSAMKLEVALCSSREDGGIETAFQRVVSEERKALIGAFRCMYFLNKREIAHTTNFLPLCELGKALGAAYLQDLRRGGNAQYTCTSERFKQELLQALAETVTMPILEDLSSSPFFALCIDETTDVSVSKQLIVYVKYLVGGTVHTSFLRVLELSNGTARSITARCCPTTQQ